MSVEDAIKLKETIIVAEAKEKKSELQLKQEIEAHIGCKESLEKALDELNTLRKKISNLETGSLVENDDKPSDSQTSEKIPGILDYYIQSFSHLVVYLYISDCFS